MPSPSLENSGRHSGQEAIFAGVLIVWGSRSVVLENGDRGSIQNFDAVLVSIAVWPGEPFLKKSPSVRKLTLSEKGMS